MMFPEIHRFPYLALDTETTGLRYPIDYAFGLSISTPDGKDYWWDFRKVPKAKEWAAAELHKYEGLIIAHNLSFDVRMCASAGIKIPTHNCDDTVTRAVMIDENHGVVYPWSKGRMTYGLDDQARHYLGIRKDQTFYEKAREFFGQPNMTMKAIMSRIAELPDYITAPYAKQDTRVTLNLWEWQEGEIEKQGIRQICDFEKKVAPTLIRNEMRGINVDVDYAEKAIPKVEAENDKIKKKLKDMIGYDLNVNSTPQIRALFEPRQESDGTWVACDGTPLETTKTGSPSFGGNALREMSHPAAALITEIRSLTKTSGTFLKKHILEHQVNGKVYPTINQTASEDGGTRTGRLSIVDPAMQQIPSRNMKVAKIVKTAFLPPEGMIWVEPDLASFEVRVFAHLVAAYNHQLVDVYKNDPSIDFHQWVADIAGLPRNAEYSGQANAKQLNLSMIFNSGNGAIAHKMGMPWEWAQFTAVDKFTGESKIIRYKKAGPEAMAVINKYHSVVQGVKELADKAKKIAEVRGYVKTGYGRRLRFRNKYKSYSASGLLIQATSGDLNKENLMLIEESLGDDGHLILNTHDSYSTAIVPDWEKPFNRMKEAIERPRLRVPLILDLDGIGKNWWSAKCNEGI